MTAPGKLTGCEENFATLLAKVCVISVVACVAAVSFPFPKKHAKEMKTASDCEKGAGGGGEATEGNTCNQTQTFYQTPPNTPRSCCAPLGCQLSHENQ